MHDSAGGFVGSRSAWRGWLRSLVPAALVALAAFAVADDPPGTIRTVAGGGVGDGGPATSAFMERPLHISRDASGNVYFADLSLNGAGSGDNRVRKFAPGGNMSTIAGNSEYGFSGDGGPGAAARLSRPQSAAADAVGNVYVVDAGNHRIRKVAPDGTITTFAGVSPGGSLVEGVAATSAQLVNPVGVAVDGLGNVYIADADARRVKVVNTGAASAVILGVTVAPGTIRTVAGTGATGLSGDSGPATAANLDVPVDVAVDGAGNLFIVLPNVNRVRRVSTAGIITTVAGGGASNFDGVSPTVAKLNAPRGIAVDGPAGGAARLLFVADTDLDRIRVVNFDTSNATVAGIVVAPGTIRHVAGTGNAGFTGDGGAATAARLSSPEDVVTDGAGGFFISDKANQRIRRVSSGGTISTVAGVGNGPIPDEGISATLGRIVSPLDVCADAAGNLFVADQTYPRIRAVNLGTSTAVMAGVAVAPGTMRTVAGTGVAGYSGDNGPAVVAQLNIPTGIDVDAGGNVFFSDRGTDRVRRIAPNGTITTVAGTGVAGYSAADEGAPAVTAKLNNPYDVAVDGSGNLFIVDEGNRRVRQVFADGTIRTIAGNGVSGFSGDGGPATSATFNFPRQIAVDASGNLYVVDGNNHRIRKIATDGTITSVATSGNTFLEAVAVDGSGNVYFQDASNLVRKLTPGGVVSVFANSNWPNIFFAGDGGPAISAPLAGASGLCTDALGSVYITDVGHGRIRRVSSGAVPPSNLPPVADAGAPQSVECAGANTSVVLDGSASNDADDDTLTYLWTGDFAGGTATGVAPTVSFAGLGDHTVTLVVNDGTVDSSQATTTVTIEDTIAPQVTIVSPSEGAVTGANSANLFVQVTDVTATHVVLGSASADVSAGVGSTTFVVSLVAGSNTFTVTATDAGGNETSAARTLVHDPDAPIVHVDAPSNGALIGAGGSPVAVMAHVDDLTATVVDSVPAGVAASLGAGGGVVTGVVGLVEGTNSITVRAADAAGRVGSGTVTVILDTTPPALAVPADIVAEATGAAGAVVVFTVTAADALDPSPAVACVPVSGSTFALGTTPVACTATDWTGNASGGTFSVTVRDTTAPSLDGVPGDMTAEATGPAGAVVTFVSPTATDLVDGAVAVSCVPPSGGVFPLGTTPVVCTATDAHGNASGASFAVTVVDTTAPLLAMPPNVVAEATSVAGAIVSFGLTASDLVDGPVAVTCVPPSGSAFGFGVTTVTCTAVDVRGNASGAVFTVTVGDTTAPSLVAPPNVTVLYGAAVSLGTPTASDACGPPTVTNDAPSTWPVGTTVVTWTATDASGNAATATQSVTVQSAAQGTQALIDTIGGMVAGGALSNAEAHPLLMKLEQARDAAAAGKRNVASNVLNAFTNQVAAYLATGKLTSADAQALTSAANAIRASLAAGG